MPAKSRKKWLGWFGGCAVAKTLAWACLQAGLGFKMADRMEQGKPVPSGIRIKGSFRASQGGPGKLRRVMINARDQLRTLSSRLVQEQLFHGQGKAHRLSTPKWFPLNLEMAAKATSLELSDMNTPVHQRKFFPIDTRSSSREVRIRGTLFSVVYFSRGTLPKKG